MDLVLRDLSLTLPASNGPVRILDHVSFELRQGERLGIVGESGSGKSMTALSILGLLPHGAERRGQILLDGQDLVELNDTAMTRIRGWHVAMVFQEPMSALNPVKTIGQQVAEAARLHLGQSASEGRRTAARWLEHVGLPSRQFPLSLYPHQLSGGQRQRVMIAAALAGEPAILIADEPTTALDATVQLQILRLIDGLISKRKLSLILISHDLGVISAMAERVVVMKDGRIVEHASVRRLFHRPEDPYTRMLIKACPALDDDREVAKTPTTGKPAPLLAVAHIHCRYARSRASFLQTTAFNDAVVDVSFELDENQCLGIVGESGSGKSTLAKSVAGLIKPTKGMICYRGSRIDHLATRQRLVARLPITMIFQDPFGSLNPRHTVRQSLLEPLHRFADSGARKRQMAVDALAAVKLDATALGRYPHQFSGGQRQRIAIARALISRPELVIADEAVASLDVSIQEQIIQLMAELRRDLGLTLIFISHDLAVIRAIADWTIVMLGGKIIEQGPSLDVFAKPQHAYTRTLLDAVLPADPAISRARVKATRNVDAH